MLTSFYLLEGSNDWSNPSATLGAKMIEYSATLREACQSFEKLTNEGQLHVDYNEKNGRWTI